MSEEMSVQHHGPHHNHRGLCGGRVAGGAQPISSDRQLHTHTCEVKLYISDILRYNVVVVSIRYFLILIGF